MKLKFIVRVETHLIAQGEQPTEAFAEELLRSLVAVDPDGDMAAGSRAGVYNIWTVVDADAPEDAALKGVTRVRDAARVVGRDAAGKVRPRSARVQSVEAYPSVEDEATDLAHTA